MNAPQFYSLKFPRDHITVRLASWIHIQDSKLLKHLVEHVEIVHFKNAGLKNVCRVFRDHGFTFRRSNLIYTSSSTECKCGSFGGMFLLPWPWGLQGKAAAAAAAAGRYSRDSTAWHWKCISVPLCSPTWANTFWVMSHFFLVEGKCGQGVMHKHTWEHTQGLKGISCFLPASLGILAAESLEGGTGWCSAPMGWNAGQNHGSNVSRSLNDRLESEGLILLSDVWHTAETGTPSRF